ncbi:MAG: hypothetical protein IKF22_07285 [Lachnospiraceae bacterium]|nr:hypothetical protein [Lachnospiraceae bacterium]
MRYLYVCATPYQLLNILNMHMNAILYRDDKHVHTTLCIIDIFPKTSDIADNVSKLNIFNEVYVIPEEDRKSQKNGYRKYFSLAYDVLFPGRLIKQQFGTERYNQLVHGYDAIIASVFSHTIAALRTVNRHAKLYMIDDGIGSYFGNSIKTMRSNDYLRLLRLRNRGINIAKVDALYLTQIEFSTSTLSDNVIQLPYISDTIIMTAKRIFLHQSAEELYNKQIIWLTQPIRTPALNKVSNQISQMLLSHKSSVVVRPHPREKNRDNYVLYDIDKSNNMWELMISDLQIDTKLLISYHSTALFSPKLLYDKEPYLIFAYKLLNLSYNEMLEEIICKLRDIYKNKDRICVPDSFEEMESFIDKYIKKELD